MPRLLCLLLAIAGTLAAQTSVRELMFSRPIMMPSEIVPQYDHGHLLYRERPNRLTVLSPGGQPASTIEVTCPSNGNCSVSGFAIDAEGNIAAGVSWLAGNGRTAAIRVMNKSGKELRWIPTGDYLPNVMCFDGAGNLWTAGREFSADSDRTRDYMLVRKFSREGAEIGRYLPRSLWTAKKAMPGSFGYGYWRMKAAHDRVGLLVHEGYGDAATEWVEWDLNGQLLTRTIVGDYHRADYHRAGRAYTAAGSLYQEFRPESGKRELRVLDTKTGAWVPVANKLPDTPEYERAFLLGADGGHLVYSQDSRLLLVDLN